MRQEWQQSLPTTLYSDLIYTCRHIYIYAYYATCFGINYKSISRIINILYTGCPRRNVPDFGRVFLMLKYTDITQNTYAQS